MLRDVRATIPAVLQVRFEGVAGEFAQFDFGEGVCACPTTSAAPCTSRHTGSSTRAGSTSSSFPMSASRPRFGVLESFAASGGVPLRVVFDNPKTVVVRHEDGRPVWNAVLAPVAIDYGFTIELCTPRQPQQKGAVENLVGFVKRAFFARGASPISRPICHGSSPSGSSR